VERQEQHGADWLAQEMARVHSTLQCRLVAALEELGHPYIAHAIQNSEMVEDTQTLTVRPNRIYRLYFEDKSMPGAIRQAFELLGEEPKQLAVDDAQAA
jgi:hypothetical protein